MAKKQIVSNKTAESAPVSPLIVDNVDALKARMAEVRAAQQEFATFTQEQVDKIFQAAAIAANQMRIPLAKMAVKFADGQKNFAFPNAFTDKNGKQRKQGT